MRGGGAARRVSAVAGMGGRIRGRGDGADRRDVAAERPGLLLWQGGVRPRQPRRRRDQRGWRARRGGQAREARAVFTGRGVRCRARAGRGQAPGHRGQGALLVGPWLLVGGGARVRHAPEEARRSIGYGPPAPLLHRHRDQVRAGQALALGVPQHARRAGHVRLRRKVSQGEAPRLQDGDGLLRVRLRALGGDLEHRAEAGARAPQAPPGRRGRGLAVARQRVRRPGHPAAEGQRRHLLQPDPHAEHLPVAARAQAPAGQAEDRRRHHEPRGHRGAPAVPRRGRGRHRPVQLRADHAAGQAGGRQGVGAVQGRQQHPQRAGLRERPPDEGAHREGGDQEHRGVPALGSAEGARPPRHGGYLPGRGGQDHDAAAGRPGEAAGCRHGLAPRADQVGQVGYLLGARPPEAELIRSTWARVTRARRPAGPGRRPEGRRVSTVLLDGTEQLINGLMYGCFYALIGGGFTLLFGVLRRFNLAYGSTIMAGAYAGLIPVYLFNAPVLVLFVTTIVVSVLVGLLVEFCCFRFLRKGHELAPLMTTIGMLIVIDETIVYLTDAVGFKYPAPFGDESLALGPFLIRPDYLAILVVSVVSFSAIFYLLYRARFGRAMRAVAERPDAAQILGVSVRHVNVLTFVLTSALARIIGVFAAVSVGSARPEMAAWLTGKASW